MLPGSRGPGGNSRPPPVRRAIFFARACRIRPAAFVEAGVRGTDPVVRRRTRHRRC